MSENTEEETEVSEEAPEKNPEDPVDEQSDPREEDEPAQEPDAVRDETEESPSGNGSLPEDADPAERDQDESLVSKAGKALKDRLGLSKANGQDDKEKEPELSHEELREAHREAVKKLEELKVERDQILLNLARSYDQVKRLERRNKEVRKYGAESLARDILGTYDHFGRALAAGRTNQDMDLKSWLEGIEGVERDFSRTLARHGISEISPKEGEKFDPAWHEALYNVPVPDQEPGTVIQVQQTGFRLHDRLLRPAKVGVVARLDSLFVDDSDEDEE